MFSNIQSAMDLVSVKINLRFSILQNYRLINIICPIFYDDKYNTPDFDIDNMETPFKLLYSQKFIIRNVNKWRLELVVLSNN